MIRQVYAVALESIYEPGAKMGGQNATIGTLITPIISNVLIISGLFAFMTIIFAGFSYIAANGDKGKIEQSQNMLNYAILGLIVVVTAFLITRVVGAVIGFKFF